MYVQQYVRYVCTADVVPFSRHVTLRNIVTLKSRSEVTHHANLCTTCTSLTSIDPGLSFLSARVWVYFHSLPHSKPNKKLYRWRSFKVIQGNRNLYNLKAHMWLSISLPMEDFHLTIYVYLLSCPNIATYW